MLEICFDDSVKAALLTALHGKLQKHAVFLHGNSDVAGLSFSLSQGDLCAPITAADCPRKELLRAAFLFDRYHEEEDWAESFEDFWHSCTDDLQKLQTCGGPVRVWVDHTPDAQCGLLFTAALLCGKHTEIHLAELPAQVRRDDGTLIYWRGWREVEPEQMGAFAAVDRMLTDSERGALARQWQRLKQENAPLRAVENGRVQSVPISYYDDHIRREFPETRCTAAMLIGRALGRQNILMSDVFIAQRIQYFLDTGELSALPGTQNGFYRTVVTRGAGTSARGSAP